MSERAYPRGWYPVAMATELKAKPLRAMLCGVPLVLYRTPDGAVACLHDRCPHRSAPLSQGRIVNGQIECPYHGWRFDGTGRCTAIPFYDGALPSRYVPSMPVRERHGLIFVRHGDLDEDIYTPFWDGRGPTLRHHIKTGAKTSLINIVENVLDPTHTAFTHKGLMRGLSDKRQPVGLSLTAKDGKQLVLEFSGERQQDGWISKLTESNRTGSTTNVLRPGIVEVIYWHNENVNLVTTVYFSPITADETASFIVLTTHNRYGLAYLKAAVFLPIFLRIIGQDQLILAASYANWKAFGEPANAVSPMDYMRPNLEAILAERRPPVADEPLSFTLWL